MDKPILQASLDGALQAPAQASAYTLHCALISQNPGAHVLYTSDSSFAPEDFAEAKECELRWTNEVIPQVGWQSWFPKKTEIFSNASTFLRFPNEPPIWRCGTTASRLRFD